MSIQKIKIVYRKQGKIRFLGHLDTMRIIFRAIRRADIPVSYTNGFNPKIKCSFSPPLPLGFEGMEEFIELTLDGKTHLQTLKENLQKNLLDGIYIEGIEKIPVFGKPLNPKIIGTEYEIGFNGDFSEIRKRADRFLKKKEIFIEKKNGKKMDIKPLIFNFKINGKKCIFSISKEVNPKLFVKKFLNLTGKELAGKKIIRKRFLFK